MISLGDIRIDRRRFALAASVTALLEVPSSRALAAFTVT